MNSRWQNEYEEFTAEIIKRIALFQASLSSRESPEPVDSPDAILIALLLRCLVLTHEIFLVDGCLPHAAFHSKKNSKTRFVVEQEGTDPAIKVSRLSTMAQAGLVDREQQNRESLPLMLEEILQTTQSLMFRRRPKDWPILLCALCLLRLVLMNLNPICPWMRSLVRVGKAMNNVNSVLCRLFEMCSHGYHPFSDDWKCEDYAALVNNDKLLVSCFQWINDMWLDGMGPVHQITIVG